MSNYIIDFSDPLSTGFTINQGAYNGPGGKTSNTSLRLYGAGAREWGESINEDLVKLLENFMGASAPINPVPGQLWIETRLYYLDSSANQFYSYSYTTNTWTAITVTAATSQPAGSIGGYWYNTSSLKLFMYFQAYKQAAASFRERSFLSGTGAPTSPPRQQAKVWDKGVNAWVALPIVNITTDTTAPANNAAGTFRFDPGSKILYVWNGTTWSSLTTSGSAVFSGTIDAGNNKVINVADATAPTDGLNQRSGDARYVGVAGGTMSGLLTLSAGPTALLHAATKKYVDDSVNNVTATAGGIPIGAIMMWSSTAGTIPTGWRVCDGTHGTPDLRDRFVMSAGATFTAGSIGGARDAVVVSHTHGFTTVSDAGGAHTHTGSTDTIADHSHQTPTRPSTVVNYASGTNTLSTGLDPATVTTTGAAGSHNHTITTTVSTNHTHGISGTTNSTGASGVDANLPPYFVLAFIMRTNA